MSYPFSPEDHEENQSRFSTYRRLRREYEKRHALDPRDPERLDDEDEPEESEI